MEKDVKKNLSRRGFIKAASLAAGSALVGNSICEAKSFKGKTRSFSTDTGCDVTFYAVSDTHFGKKQSVDDETKNKQAIDKMNYIPGNLSYPASVGGGLVDAPRGLIMPGDLTDYGTSNEWHGFDSFDGFKDIYCGNGTGKLNCPVYEGYGNHDLVWLPGSSNYVKEQIKTRNLTGARPGVSNVSSNGYHYSFNWDTLHMVNLNLQPTGPGYAENSIDFLESDLQTQVGNTGRAVVLYFHSDFDRDDFWTPQDQDVFYNLIKDYNVIAIFYGHAHVGEMLVGEFRGINTYNVGLTAKARFAVVHVTDSKMVVAECINNDTWGVISTKDIGTQI